MRGPYSGVDIFMYALAEVGDSVEVAESHSRLLRKGQRYTLARAAESGQLGFWHDGAFLYLRNYLHTRFRINPSPDLTMEEML